MKITTGLEPKISGPTVIPGRERPRIIPGRERPRFLYLDNVEYPLSVELFTAEVWTIQFIEMKQGHKEIERILFTTHEPKVVRKNSEYVTVDEAPQDYKDEGIRRHREQYGVPDDAVVESIHSLSAMWTKTILAWWEVEL